MNFLKRLFQKKEKSPVVGRVKISPGEGFGRRKGDFFCQECIKTWGHFHSFAVTLEKLHVVGRVFTCLLCRRTVSYETEKEKYESA